MSSNNITSRTALSAPPPRPSLLRAISSSSSIAKSRVSPISKKDKPRLYLGLYLRGAPNTSSTSNTIFNSSVTCSSYHWAFIISPKTSSRHDPGTCFQILHSSDRSYYEETDLSTLTPSQSATLLVRITLAKVLDEQKVKSIIRSLPPCQQPPSTGHDINSSAHKDILSNDCLSWVRKTYLTLFTPEYATNSTPSSKALKTYMTIDDWAELEETARKYAKKKRNLGRFHSLGIGLNRGPGVGDGHEGWVEWEDDEIATWNFWERRETTS